MNWKTFWNSIKTNSRNFWSTLAKGVIGRKPTGPVVPKEKKTTGIFGDLFGRRNQNTEKTEPLISGSGADLLTGKGVTTPFSLSSASQMIRAAASAAVTASASQPAVPPGSKPLLKPQIISPLGVNQGVRVVTAAPLPITAVPPAKAHTALSVNNVINADITSVVPAAVASADQPALLVSTADSEEPGQVSPAASEMSPPPPPSPLMAPPSTPKALDEPVFFSLDEADTDKVGIWDDTDFSTFQDIPDFDSDPIQTADVAKKPPVESRILTKTKEFFENNEEEFEDDVAARFNRMIEGGEASTPISPASTGSFAIPKILTEEEVASKRRELGLKKRADTLKSSPQLIGKEMEALDAKLERREGITKASGSQLMREAMGASDAEIKKLRTVTKASGKASQKPAGHSKTPPPPFHKPDSGHSGH